MAATDLVELLVGRVGQPDARIEPADLELAEGWLELYNPSAAPIDLAGTVIELQNIMGGDPDRIVVRDADVTIEAQGYVVLGRLGGNLVDYAYTVDFDKDLYENARIRVLACDVVADEIVYWGLPNTGSLAYDGGLEPDAAANDNADASDSESNWCVDDTDDIGTPGEPNRACP